MVEAFINMPQMPFPFTFLSPIKKATFTLDLVKDRVSDRVNTEFIRFKPYKLRINTG
jgi:hypothetical protein